MSKASEIKPTPGVWFGWNKETDELYELMDYDEIEKLLKSEDARRVSLTDVGPYSVSTVFLFLDQGFGGKPRFFETMVFSGKKRVRDFDDLAMRYTTAADARAGHEGAVRRVKERLGLKEG